MDVYVSSYYASAGGMPVGTNGKSCVIGRHRQPSCKLDDSRGVELTTVNFQLSHINDRSKEKIDLCRILTGYCDYKTVCCSIYPYSTGTVSECPIRCLHCL